MQINMSIVGMSNVTITCFSSKEENNQVYHTWLQNHKSAVPGDVIPEELLRKGLFHLTKRRLSSDGAEKVQLFPV